MNVLRAHDFNLHRIITSDPLSPLFPGSEFRPAQHLQPLLDGHPLWHNLLHTITNGTDCLITALDETDRQAELQQNLARGNHKSAAVNAKHAFALLMAEVDHGWQLPLPLNNIQEIPHLCLAPMGLADQFTLDDGGNLTAKQRLTHDQSWSFKPGTAFNERIGDNNIGSCVYGHAIRRILHQIIGLREKFPGIPVLITKADFKAAYRRLHQSGHTALQSVVSTQGLTPSDIQPMALLSLRATFGGKHYPATWSDISESITDLCNSLVRCDEWDPSTLQSSYSKLVGDPIIPNPSAHLAPAHPMLVDPQVDCFGCTDVYLDDVISVFPAISSQHIARGVNAPLLLIEAFGRPVIPNGEQLPRDDLLSLNKIAAEGTASERATVLGWALDTRALTIGIPTDKWRIWDLSIQNILENPEHHVSYTDLARLVGRLTNATTIMPPAAHFMSRLRFAESRANQRRTTRLTGAELLDLKLWRDFLSDAHSGLDINLIVTRRPDWLLRTDACTIGLGGFNITNGRAWQYLLPNDLVGKKSINFLEFLACSVSLILTFLEEAVSAGSCVGVLGDNTSSLGWLRKSNFAPVDESAAHLGLARLIAALHLETKTCGLSQWFAGEDNGVADTLSREFGMSTPDLTARITSLFPSQVPSTFHINPLPNEITSLISYWVRLEHLSTPSPPTPINATNVRGNVGYSSWKTRASTTTHTCSPTPPANSNSFSPPSPRPTAQNVFPPQQKELADWLAQHAKPPSITWQRPFATPASPTRASTHTGNLASFYKDCTRVMPTMTQASDTRSASLPA